MQELLDQEEHFFVLFSSTKFLLLWSQCWNCFGAGRWKILENWIILNLKFCKERVITSKGSTHDILKQLFPEGCPTVPPLAYNEFFISPWATTRDLEVKHQNLMVLIGNDLKDLLSDWLIWYHSSNSPVDLGVEGYLLLYGTTIYNTDLDSEKFNERDKSMIIKGRNILGTILRRYLKHSVGWKKGNHKALEVEKFLRDLQSVSVIYSQHNIRLVIKYIF